MHVKQQSQLSGLPVVLCVVVLDIALTRPLMWFSNGGQPRHHLASTFNTEFSWGAVELR